MDNQNNDKPIVQLTDVIKSFSLGENAVTVLKGVSLQISAGEAVSIVGPSGSGKSTLLNMITGIDRPSAGQVMVLGAPVHEMSENELARWRGQQVGIIFQFFQLLPSLTLLKNVILPMDLAGKYTVKERRARAHHLLDIVGLADQAHKLPGMVSGGQQQRAAIARALANDPPLLVTDEPTGNLDTVAAQKVLDLFQNLVEGGKTLLMVTHDKDLAQQIPRTIEIVDGNIARDGFAHPQQAITLDGGQLHSEYSPAGECKMANRRATRAKLVVPQKTIVLEGREWPVPAKDALTDGILEDRTGQDEFPYPQKNVELDGREWPLPVDKPQPTEPVYADEMAGAS